MRVTITDTAREPRHPRRLEKNTNILASSFDILAAAASPRNGNLTVGLVPAPP
jgi:hypothetical protein